MTPSKLLITRIEALLDLQAQRQRADRGIIVLTADELKYSNPITATGTIAEVLVEAHRVAISRAIK